MRALGYDNFALERDIFLHTGWYFICGINDTIGDGQRKGLSNNAGYFRCY